MPSDRFLHLSLQRLPDYPYQLQEGLGTAFTNVSTVIPLRGVLNVP